MYQGGIANKLGNEYERKWAVLKLLDVVAGVAKAIQYEGILKEFCGFEFALHRPSHVEWHQTKINAQSGNWTLKALDAAGVIPAFGRRLSDDADARCIFISQEPARQVHEICLKVRTTNDAQEFQSAGSIEDRETFDKLANIWNIDKGTTFEWLRRCEFRTESEQSIDEKIALYARHLLRGDEDLYAVLSNYLIENLNTRITTEDARKWIREVSPFSFRPESLDPTLREEVEAANRRYLESYTPFGVAGKRIARDETDTVLAGLQAPNGPSLILLTGEAGSGKSGIVREVMDGLAVNAVPHLAFRMDRFLDHGRSDEIGTRLLDVDESPVSVLENMASGERSVLIADQIDAVSEISGRAGAVKDALFELVRETRLYGDVRCLLVCRSFDLENDPQYHALEEGEKAQRISVLRLSWENDVEPILKGAGTETEGLTESQRNLLCLPLNLAVFLEIGDPTFDFATGTALMQKLLDKKTRDLRRDRNVGWNVQKPLSDMANWMSDKQILSCPDHVLDAFDGARDWLLSEGLIIVVDRHRLAFFHESFFDYCFARWFFNRPESLVSFLKGAEQHLFRRAQVRQVLAYLRDADRDRYLQELAGLLLDKGIRAHIKDLVFALLAEVPDPGKEEWEIWRQWTTPKIKAIEDGAPNPDKLSQVAWRRFFGSPSWFAWIDKRGMVKGWLASGNDRLADMATNYLRVHQRHSPDRIAALLEPYADCGGAWPQRLQVITSWSGRHASRRFFDLVLHLVDNGTLDEARLPIATNSTFWDIFYGLDETCPEWFAEVLAHRLRRRVAVIRNAGDCLKSGDLIGFDCSVAGMISKSAKDAPAAFVQHVLPVLLEISDAASTDDDERLKRDDVWSVLIKTEHPGGEDACLAGLAQALSVLVREGTADLGDIIARIASLRRRDTHVANHLLLALYAGGAARHADEAVLLLCEEPWRFECGFSGSPHWCAMETIRAVLPHCTAENRQKIEAAILDYVPAYECTRYGYKNYGPAQFELLSAITPELRSARAQARFGELERKFGTPPGEPRGIVAGSVKPPIEKDDAVRMTDNQWLGAIAKHDLDERPRHEDFKGGVRDLAQVLEAQAKEEPERFARLGLRLPANANPVYLDRTLAALTGAPAAADLKLQICRKAFEEALEACGKSIADLIGSIEAPLPDEAVRMLQRLATEHEDPTREVWQDTQPLSVIDIRQMAESASGETSTKDAGDSKAYYNGDPHHHGINTTRGRAARVIQKLILTDPTYVDWFRPALERMVRDPSAAVRSCVAETLWAVARHDPAFGMSLFLKMDLSEDRLLATVHVCRFIHDALRDNFAAVEPVVKRMLHSPEPDVRKAGGRLASLAALHGQNSASLVDEALRGDACARFGVADVASAHIDVPQCRAWCEARLVALFDDEDVTVRREAASCFRRVGHGTLETLEELIAKFCDSKAFQEDSASVLHALEKTRGQLPGTTCDVCERFLDRFSDEARDIRTSRAGDAHYVTKLVFQTYQQHQDDKWTTRSLDLIDRLCLERSNDAQRAFEQFER